MAEEIPDEWFKTHKCDYPGCTQFFPKLWRLKEHKCSAHGGERSFVCSHVGCEKSFVRAYHLKRHMLSHLETKPEFRCPVDGCERSYKSQQSLNKHKKTHSDPLPYKCPEADCPQAFKKHSQLAAHRVRHSGDVRPFKCAQCDASYVWPSELRKHLLRKHQEFQGYNCSHEGCEVQCPTWTAMRKHLATHSYECEDCGKSFKSMYQLKAHSVTHSDLRPVYPCEWEGCSSVYTTKYNLQQHIKNFHERKKEFPCSHEGCSSFFSTKQAVKRHLVRVHEKFETSKPKKARKPRGKKGKSLSSKLSGYSNNSKTSPPWPSPHSQSVPVSGYSKPGSRPGAAAGTATAAAEQDSREAVPGRGAEVTEGEGGNRKVEVSGQQCVCSVLLQANSSNQEPPQLLPGSQALGSADGAGCWPTGRCVSTLS